MESIEITLFEKDKKYYKKINQGSGILLNIENLNGKTEKFRDYLKNRFTSISTEKRCNDIGNDFLVDFGKELFYAIFESYEFLDFDRSLEKICRLNFIIESEELVNYPWELMHNGTDWLTNLGFSIVRFTANKGKKDISFKPPLKLISLVCIPPGYQPNDPESIQKEINGIINGINKEKGFELIKVIPLTNIFANQISNVINEHNPHIFLFIGHGAEEGEPSILKMIKLNNSTEREEVELFDYKKVRDLFLCKGAQEHLGLVILSGCRTAKVFIDESGTTHNSVAQAVIDAGIPNCIGMLDGIDIKDAFLKFPQDFLKNFLNDFFNNLSLANLSRHF